MKTLWFKGRDVAPILSGGKTDTLRTPSPRLPRVRETVVFAVGQRGAFAKVIIQKKEHGQYISLGRRRQLAEHYGCDMRAPFIRLEFRVVETMAAFTGSQLKLAI
jgi:hypothetical protein